VWPLLGKLRGKFKVARKMLFEEIFFESTHSKSRKKNEFYLSVYNLKIAA